MVLKLCSARTRTRDQWIQSPDSCQLDHGRKQFLKYRLWYLSSNLPVPMCAGLLAGLLFLLPVCWQPGCLEALGGWLSAMYTELQPEFTSPTPLPDKGRVQERGRYTLHSTMRTHTDTHQLVDCRLHFDRTPPHVHRVCQGGAGGCLVDGWHLCGSRGG